MCGIAGYIDINDGALDPGILVRMNRAIRHRGTDDEGYVFIDRVNDRRVSVCGEDSPFDVKNSHPKVSDTEIPLPVNIGLAHRRFSIIDLTSGGHQPFFSSDNSCCVIFNGEIYNHVELRQELEGQGCVFHTASDTEVLIEAYRLWGADCFQRLNGFWALAIYDFKQRQLILSRDRLGKKPLYWTRMGSRIYFASEIKALLQVTEVSGSKSVNQTLAYLWLAYGLRDVDGQTMFEGIYSFPPASWAVVNPDFPNEVRRFWQVPGERLSENDVGVDEAGRSVRDLLRDSVRIRLRADVPWSVELSGGLDSSVLVAMASEVHAGRLRTYTVRFPEKQWNEEPFARSVLNRYPLDYQVLESPIDNFWLQILPFTSLQEEPYHAPNLQTNQVIWTMMRAAGTKISLNGAAGDELFAGYGVYFRNAQYENLLSGRMGQFVKNAFNWSEETWTGKGLAWSIASSLQGIPVLQKTLAMLTNQSARGATRLDEVAYPLAGRKLTDILHGDMTNTKIPYWLRSGDKTYMGVPFEVRAPYLDYRLVEYVFQLPGSYLIRDGWHKWILRHAMKELLPDEIVWRRKKMGFPFPFERFYAESEPILRLIFAFAENPYIELSKVNPIKNNWRFISFLLWYELFFNENMPLFRAIEDLAGVRNKRVDYGYKPEFLDLPTGFG